MYLFVLNKPPTNYWEKDDPWYATVTKRAFHWMRTFAWNLDKKSEQEYNSSYKERDIALLNFDPHRCTSTSALAQVH